MQLLYKAFFEEAQDAMLAVHLDSLRILACNKALCQLTGFSEDELIGESASLLQATKDPESRDRIMDRETLLQPGFYNDIQIATRDSSFRLVTLKLKHIELDSKPIALAVLSDDTERQLLVRDLTAKHQSLEAAFVELEQVHAQLKSSQDRMAQAAKLAALGELAAGLSHELNQPLTGVRGFAQESLDLLKTEPKPSKKSLRELLEKVMNASDKMAGLLSHFRDLARRDRGPENEKPTPLSLEKSVRSVLSLMSRQFKNHNIEIHADQLDHMALGMGPRVEQILINLLTNSRDSILEKQKRVPSLQPGHIKISARAIDHSIELRVQDSGAGIPPTIQAKIFDPFFSTKEQGQGMGLGLSISFSLAARMGGELKLESSSSSGTTFVLRLPQATEQRSAA